jgi:hypothetical protein
MCGVGEFSIDISQRDVALQLMDSDETAEVHSSMETNVLINIKFQLPGSFSHGAVKVLAYWGDICP